jgi:hypothetical protein
MSSQHSPSFWIKSLLGIALLISATLFDGSGAVIGVILNGTGLNWGAQAANADHTSVTASPRKKVKFPYTRLTAQAQQVEKNP